jgi:hypothetical protein
LIDRWLHIGTVVVDIGRSSKILVSVNSSSLCHFVVDCTNLNHFEDDSIQNKAII